MNLQIFHSPTFDRKMILFTVYSLILIALGCFSEQMLRVQWLNYCVAKLELVATIQMNIWHLSSIIFCLQMLGTTK